MSRIEAPKVSRRPMPRDRRAHQAGLADTHRSSPPQPSADLGIRRWSVGFRFFREIKSFGLDSSDIDRRWLLSVLYRLQELSSFRVTELRDGHGLHCGTLRLHAINWNGRNVPLSPDDLDWIDPLYRGSEDFPIIQIAVSKAVGRLVGFHDEEGIFQIVLLDPLHNAQPSKFNDYKVRLSKPLGCEITALRHEVGQVMARSRERGCGCDADLAAALEWRRDQRGHAIVIPVVDGTEIDDADQLIAEGRVGSYRDIFAAGLVAVLERRLDS